MAVDTRVPKRAESHKARAPFVSDPWRRLKAHMATLRTMLRMPQPQFREDLPHLVDYFRIPPNAPLDDVHANGLARQILDAIPIQIFIKGTAPIENGAENKGRPYIYRNRYAKYMSGAPLDEPESGTDKDAISDEAEWLLNYERETQFLKAGGTRELKAPWTSKKGFRLNEVKLFKIFEDGDANKDPASTEQPCAFVAIAEDITYQKQSVLWQGYAGVLRHDFNNLSQQLADLLDATTEAYKEGDHAKAHSCRQQVFGHLYLLETSLNCLSAAWDYEALSSFYPANDIVRIIRNAASRLPIDLEETIEHDCLATPLPGGGILPAVLIELLRNAFKYTAYEYVDEVTFRREIRFSLRRGPDDTLVWTVSNRTKADIPNIYERARSKPGHGADLIVTLLHQQLYPLVREASLISQARDPSEPLWFCTSVITPLSSRSRFTGGSHA